MDIRLEIPFDETTFINKGMIRWNIANQKTKRTTMSMFIIWGIMNIIGLFSGIKSGEYVSWQSVIGFFILLYGLYLLILLIRGKRKFRKEMQTIAEKCREKNLKSLYEFTDKNFYYADHQNELRLDWDNFQSYSIKDKYIFINQNDSLELSIVFDRDELTNQGYDDLKQFLSTKLKLKIV